MVLVKLYAHRYYILKIIIPELVAKRHNISKGLHLKALKLASLAEIFGFPDFH